MSSAHPPAKKKLSSSERLRAIVRVRPLIAREGKMKCLDVKDGSNIVFKEGRYSFDRVYSENESQSAIYREAIAPIVESWVSGYNACVFAYGQTGSGKTFTMLGDNGGRKTKQLDGIIPRVAEDVFKKIASEEAEFTKCMKARGEVSSMSQYQVRVSYVEIHNDDVRDLIGTEDPPAVLSIRESTNGRVYVENCREVEVQSTADVVKVIKDGSFRRATGRTEMNKHSSRSHAVLTMVVEHRWKLASEDSCNYNSKVSYLNLVDLAGSERSNRTGNKDASFRESISINSGLFALGNVITALAEGAKHVPYRDSSLTRLLQSSLCGDSRATMIACVSPAAENLDETLATIKYTQIAKKVKVAPTMHIDVKEDTDITQNPLRNDIEDPDQKMNRRTLWIDTEYHGSIFCRAMGNENDPLILFIHGSGPTNSSVWWNGIMHELSVITPTHSSFFLVAIDCPGYGNTCGDRQDIRSYPGSVVRDIVKSLGRSKAFAICGSSQGACATFNAVLEVPDITEFIIVMDPVGHDVFRYKAIKQPALLLFDVDDAGHPVKVGRWMRDNLDIPHYFEFSSKKEPFWHSDNMVSEMMNMFSRHAKTALKKVSKFARHGELGGIMTRLAGGLVSWCENTGIGAPLKHLDEGILQPPSSFLQEMLGDDLLRQLSIEDDYPHESTYPTGKSSRSDWETSADARTGKVFYHNKKTGETTWTIPDALVSASDSANAPPAATTKKVLFDSETESEEAETESPEEAAKRVSLERSETICNCCGGILWNPHRLEVCRHVLCQICFIRTHKVTKCCPLTDCALIHVNQRIASDTDHHLVIVSTISAKEAATQQANVRNFQKQRSQHTRITIEYGNTAIGSSGEAYTVKAFLKVVKVEKAGGAVPQISRVEFDINPRYPNSAVKVQSPPYTMERTMAMKFSCNIAIRWKDGTAAHTVFPYRIHHAPCTTRRATLILTGCSKGSKKSIYLPSVFPEVEI
eukprot:TRINITY_DN226_c0_g4_i1.p1 TRINITY_DN226_c0_g4~~TRINITY_DN226_c0_g4_i1.p1  ORF type:complete len:976 (+),score=153.21 TRINITY_DN226_c0_g4_i1:43-2970(+)